MKGLLLKDFFTLSRQLRLFLVMLVIFALVPGMDLAAFAIVYAAILPLSAIAYDEQAKWDQLAVMLPYTPTQLVASKYLLGYLCCIAATLLSLLAQVAVPLISGAPLDPVALGGSLLSMVAAGIVQALMLPAVFRFGAEKGRLIILVLVVLFVGLCSVLPVSELDTLQPSFGTVAIVLVLILAAVNLLSIRLSMHFYLKRVMQ